MANLSDVLKNLIRRVARRRFGKTPAPRERRFSISARYRHAQAATRSQAKVIAFLKSQERTTAGTNGQPESPRKDRGFRLGRVGSARALGLTRKQFAKLVGVSPLTVFNWEHRKSRPRQARLRPWWRFAAWDAARSQKLELLEAASKKAPADAERYRGTAR
jgi:DNA-binding transcriptional regulator YiaG